MKPFRISQWPNAKATSEAQRKDIVIKDFEGLQKLFCESIKPVGQKINQKLITRRWQKTRARDNSEYDSNYLITLDYDSVGISPCEVSDKLADLGIKHFIFSTWTHKTIETPQKKNNGKNCFKVVIDLIASNEKDLVVLTNGLGALVGKTDIKKVDDISSGIFLGGSHPDFIDEVEILGCHVGMDEQDLKILLMESAPEVKEVKQDPMDDFEMWDKTAGQKYTPDRIKKALATIKYEEVDGFSKMAIWYSLGYSLHSTGDNDNFELWDDWCLENCGEHGVYNREENEKFWAKQTVPDSKKDLCTLSTLWHLEKLFKQRQATSEIRQTSWTFFDTLAETEPEEVKFIIKDLLVENSIGFLVGSGGVGKSSLCLEVAKAISSGEDFFGDPRYPTIQGTVAIINKEDSLLKVHNQTHNLVQLDIDRLIKKQQTIESDFGEDNGVVLNVKQHQEIKDKWKNVARPAWAQSTIRVTNQEGEDLEALGAIIGSLKSLQNELVETKRPKLSTVIFDPMNMFQGGDQNSQRDMSFMFSAFQQIQRDLGVTVIIVHHMNKSSGFSGSHTIRDSGRFMWYLRPLMVGKEETDFIDFYVEKNNDAKANYSALQFYRTDKGLLDTAILETDKPVEG